MLCIFMQIGWPHRLNLKFNYFSSTLLSKLTTNSLNLNSLDFNLLASANRPSKAVHLRSVCMEASFVGGKLADEVDKSRSTLAAKIVSLHSSHTLTLLLARPYCLTPLMELSASSCHRWKELGRNQRFLGHMMVYHWRNGHCTGDRA